MPEPNRHVDACYDEDGWVICPKTASERHLAPGWELEQCDPLRPPDDFDPEPRRRPLEPDRSGMVIVYAAAGILAVLIAIAVLAASRSGPDPTAPSPTPPDAVGFVQAKAVSAASASGPSQSGAPRMGRGAP